MFECANLLETGGDKVRKRAKDNLPKAGMVKKSRGRMICIESMNSRQEDRSDASGDGLEDYAWRMSGNPGSRAGDSGFYWHG